MTRRDKVLSFAGWTITVALIADLLSPRRAHLPVCMHEDYWRRKVQR